jgi:hypothetical protein
VVQSHIPSSSSPRRGHARTRTDRRPALGPVRKQAGRIYFPVG